MNTWRGIVEPSVSYTLSLNEVLSNLVNRVDYEHLARYCSSLV